MKILALLVAAGAFCIAVAACGGGSSSSSSSSGSSAGGDSSSPSTQVADTSGGSGGEIAVVGCTLTDPFCSAWKAGAEAAGPAAGVRVNFIGIEATAQGVSKGIESAAATDAAGISAPGWFPEVETKQFKDLTESGTPMVMTNANPTDQELEESGALAVVGSNEVGSGERAAEIFLEEGLKNILCVNHTPGSITLEQRCEGAENVMKASGGNVKMLNIPYEDSSNPGKVEQDIKGAVASDDSIEAVFTLGSGVAEYAVRSVGSDLPVGTCDVSSGVLEDVESGKVLFAIDQQPFLQGYYSVLILAQYNELGLQPVGRVLTGPLAITKENVGRVLEVNKEHPGVRGAA